MNSPPSDSEPGANSSSFPLLHTAFQQWVYDEGWTSLHDAQEKAIGPIIEGHHDVIISAATAAGKTEAAFLPICSVLVNDAAERVGAPTDPWLAHDPWNEPTVARSVGIEVLYVSPLKALINDQFQRLEMICSRGDIPVHRWHGDVTGSAKQKVLRSPSGVLLITPESLEAQFVNRGTSVPIFLGGLRYVVIDELHSFLATPRGAQLQSLLHRVEVSIGRTVPRIGLSATLGDMDIAARFIRPENPDQVVVVNSNADGQALLLKVQGYRAAAPNAPADRTNEVDDSEVDSAAELDADHVDIAEDLFRKLRGTDNLIFANSRREVEVYADLLARKCERERIPNEFWPHHGSLSKDARETVEMQLKDGTRPVTAVCTSTLELGIDIGTVVSVAQVGPPPSVASLRQRIGRSGRRDEAAVGRIYITEQDIDGRSSPVDELRVGVVQTVAMVQLFLDHWVESPDDPGLNLSTFVQQVLSMIAQSGGATARDIFETLCGPGPFELIDIDRFTRLMRVLLKKDLMIQAADGLLLHGTIGERIVNHYSFYTAFQTPEEWKIVADGRNLGTLPITQPLVVGGLLIFGGRRWRIVAIDIEGKVVDLTRSKGGLPPHFGGTGALLGDRVRAQMAAVYVSDQVPPWLDREAKSLLAEGRTAWSRYKLGSSAVLPVGNDSLVFPWLGDRALVTAALQFGLLKIDANREGPALMIHKHSPVQLKAVANSILKQPKPDPIEMAMRLANTLVDKWDWVLNDELLAEATAMRLLDIDGAWTLFEAIANHSDSDGTTHTLVH